MGECIWRCEDDHGTVNHCHIVETGNESYRFRHSSATDKTRIKAREQSKRGKVVVEDETI